jgi:hypothetical protein
MTLKPIVRKTIQVLSHRKDQILKKQIIQSHAHAAPDFLIIGVTKGGTTSLFQYLIQHPDIIAPNKKEVAYFSWNHKMGLKGYLQNFPFKKAIEHQLTFEATPSYLFYKNAAAKVAKFFPEMKLFAILRDPVQRAYSHWQFYHNSKFVDEKSHLKDKRSFEIAVKEELSGINDIPWHSRYINISIYAKHIKKWYEYFDKKQLVLLDSNELKNHPKITLKKVTDSLNIQPYYQDFKRTEKRVEGLLETPDKKHEQTLIEYNVNQYEHEIDKETEKMLWDFLVPYNKELKRLTGQMFSWMR